MDMVEFRPGQLVFLPHYSKQIIFAYEKESGCSFYPPMAGSIGLFLEIDMRTETWGERNKRAYVLIGDAVYSVLRSALRDIPKYIVNRK